MSWAGANLLALSDARQAKNESDCSASAYLLKILLQPRYGLRQATSLL